ncbi:MAG: polysaccharide deacetylase family protein [Thiolinea sp.]
MLLVLLALILLSVLAYQVFAGALQKYYPGISTAQVMSLKTPAVKAEVQVLPVLKPAANNPPVHTAVSQQQSKPVMTAAVSQQQSKPVTVATASQQQNESITAATASQQQSKPVTAAAIPSVLSPKRSNPDEKRIGIVFSELSGKHFWNQTAYSQLFMSVQSQVRMAGVPYDFLTDKDLLNLEKLIQYDSLVFPYSAFVDQADLATIEKNLSLASHLHQVGLIVAGGFLTSDQTGKTFTDNAYGRMNNLLSLNYTGWAGPAQIRLEAADISHPVMKAYKKAELLSLVESNGYTEYFEPNGVYPARVLATQVIPDKGEFNAVVAVESGGRNVHFASPKVMADANVLWSAIRWSVFGESIPVGLMVSRHDAMFAARNDMDQSKIAEKVRQVHIPLLALLRSWKKRFDFVGSFYINIGDNQAKGEFTDWTLSGPLYKEYMRLGNEIGTHSYTHPMDTNKLDSEQIEYEFARSREVIEEYLGLDQVGAAVPGATEALPASLDIIQHTHYLSGGYSGVGAGFPNAFGYLLPDQEKVYLGPNMSFDFTLIEFKKMTAQEAETVWGQEFDKLLRGANKPLLHWPWHDYAAIDIYSSGYSKSMFEEVLKKAHELEVEFVTVGDIAKRISSFHEAELDVIQADEQSLQVVVSATDMSTFAIELPKDKHIAAVDDWYAYNKNQVFLAEEGGEFNIKLGKESGPVTRISALPARARLLSLGGDGQNLEFSLYGEGEIEVTPKCGGGKIAVTGEDVKHEVRDGKLYLNFTKLQDYPSVVVTVDCDK